MMEKNDIKNLNNCTMIKGKSLPFTFLHQVSISLKFISHNFEF